MLKGVTASLRGVSLINVLMLSNHDYGGSGWLIKRAVESTGLAKVTHVKGSSHPYGYQSDITLVDATDRAQALEALKSCDIIHFKGDDPPPFVLGGMHVTYGDSKPKLITVGGSSFRRKRDGLSDYVAGGRYEDELYLQHADCRVALTPDLNYPWFKGEWIPAPIEMPNTPCWQKPTSTIRIGHSPQSRRKKGTDSVFLPAVKILQEKGYDIEPVVLENMLHAECVEKKRSLDIFWDQCVVGAYGNSALEAMCHGIPTMCHIAEISISQAEGQFDDCPVINFDPTPQSCANAMMSLIDSGMTEVSKKTYEWTKNTHGLNAVGERYIKAYDRLLQ